MKGEATHLKPGFSLGGLIRYIYNLLYVFCMYLYN